MYACVSAYVIDIIERAKMMGTVRRAKRIGIVRRAKRKTLSIVTLTRAAGLPIHHNPNASCDLTHLSMTLM